MRRASSNKGVLRVLLAPSANTNTLLLIHYHPNIRQEGFSFSIAIILTSYKTRPLIVSLFRSRTLFVRALQNCDAHLWFWRCLLTDAPRRREHHDGEHFLVCIIITIIRELTLSFSSGVKWLRNILDMRSLLSSLVQALTIFALSQIAIGEFW